MGGSNTPSPLSARAPTNRETHVAGATCRHVRSSVQACSKHDLPGAVIPLFDVSTHAIPSFTKKSYEGLNYYLVLRSAPFNMYEVSPLNHACSSALGGK